MKLPLVQRLSFALVGAAGILLLLILMGARISFEIAIVIVCLVGFVVWLLGLMTVDTGDWE